jgi:hypothetical protein
MQIMSNLETTALILGWIGIGYWGVCFWWMHRLSSRQEAMLKNCMKVTKRIERLSKTEHDLIQEVHPSVEKIKESVEDVAEKVSDDEWRGSGPPGAMPKIICGCAAIYFRVVAKSSPANSRLKSASRVA